MTRRKRPPERSDEDRHREAMRAAWAGVRVAWVSTVVATISLAVSLPYGEIAGVFSRQDLFVKSQPQQTALISSQDEQPPATNLSAIRNNFATSIRRSPSIWSDASFVAGTLLGRMGIPKIKESVTNPGQTPLQQGAIRFRSGGGLFALPIVYDAVRNTIGDAREPVNVEKPSFDVF